ncbi:Protein of unknown function [Cotesia congregata]|uniref:Uncharacterized protein n=1 Tax=Cotesia congregata TaxID=51543 RepID=A0A8J2E543_COTCN|nr:Protein of unknown function [Cotesia congregata]CAG5093414.1 Protein of unknown function [Cotesia congregata]
MGQIIRFLLINNEAVMEIRKLDVHSVDDFEHLWAVDNCANQTVRLPITDIKSKLVYISIKSLLCHEPNRNYLCIQPNEFEVQ